MAEKTSATATAAKPDEGMSKKEAVRRALKMLGNGAGPLQLQGFLKKEFTISMTTDHISNYKSDILRKEGGAAKKPIAKKPMIKKIAKPSKLVKPAPKPVAPKPMVAKPVAPKPMGAAIKPAPKPAPRPAGPASHAMPGGKSSTYTLADIKAVQGLADRLGTAHLKNLIDVFG